MNREIQDSYELLAVSATISFLVRNKFNMEFLHEMADAYSKCLTHMMLAFTIGCASKNETDIAKTSIKNKRVKH